MAKLTFDDDSAPSEPVQKWLGQIANALSREKNFRNSAHKIVENYEGKLTNADPFAILYSNTETLAPSVYNARPVPIVSRRFKDADPLGKASSEVGTRLLKFLIEEETMDYDPFDDLMTSAVINALVTNRGVTRFKYHANVIEQEEAVYYENECIYGEEVRWDKFFHGYARTWKKVPWIGFEHDMSPAEFSAEFPDVKPTKEAPKREDGESSSETKGVQIVKVYEIWDKASKKVYFISPAHKEGFLREIDDPLGLKGFFPVPRPLNFHKKISTLIPTPLYVHYEEQAKELNELTRRLRAVIKACKVRGFYDNTIDGIDKLLEAEDNVLLPIENRQAMPDNMGLDKMLWLMPLNELVQTAQTLYQAREQCKQVIYEITGISDILRGASVASETATAQNIKNQWGTLRLKKAQKEVQRYVRDCLKIMLELAVSNLEINTIRQMTNLQFPTAEEKMQLEAQAEGLISQAQAAGQPPQLPPEIQQTLSAPSWEEIIGLLKNDVLREYRVEIETNSTIDAEAANDKQEIAELLNALSQFMNGIAPLVQQGSMPYDVAKQILLAVCRRYTFGEQLEDALNSMQAPEPQSNPEDEAKAKLAEVEMQRAQMEFQMEQARSQQELQLSQAEHAMKLEELNLKQELMREQFAMDRAKIQLEKISMENKLNFEKRRHENKMKQVDKPETVGA